MSKSPTATGRKGRIQCGEGRGGLYFFLHPSKHTHFKFSSPVWVLDYPPVVLVLEAIARDLLLGWAAAPIRVLDWVGGGMRVQPALPLKRVAQRHLRTVRYLCQTTTAKKEHISRSKVNYFVYEIIRGKKAGEVMHTSSTVISRVVVSGRLSTGTGDHDGNVSETIKLIAEDKRSTWICEIDMILGSSCLTCDFNCFIFRLLTGHEHHFEKLP